MAPVGILEVRGPGTTRAYVLNGDPVSVGRAADNAVVLDDASVSRHHARIEWVASEPHVSDLGSANGTTINDETVPPNVPHRLVPGDSVLVVDYQLTYLEPMAGAVERRDISDRPLPDDRPAVLTRADPSRVTLVVNTKQWAKEFSIQEGMVSLGRDPASDICIDEPVVSWHHARLEQVDHGTQILDLGSSNGLTCQQVQIAQMLLADGDQVWIAGDVSLIFKVTQLAPEVAAAELPAGGEAAAPTPAVGPPAFEKV